MTRIRHDSWPECIIEGELFFEYMIHNFNSMFNNESSIKDFNIRDEELYHICSREIMEKYGVEIEKELIPWIKEQHSNGQLFEKDNWKPFRDICSYSEIYLG